MSSLSGIFQRPVIAASVVAIASLSADFHDKSLPSRTPDNSSTLNQPNSSIKTNSSWVSQISASKFTNLSFVSRIRTPIPNVAKSFPSFLKSTQNSIPNNLYSSAAASSSLLESYQSAELAKIPKSYTYPHYISLSSSSSESVYMWRLPDPEAVDLSCDSDFSAAKSKTVVVLLGWLGAKQKHLKKYADWYTSRGFHVITFTFPMAEILSYKVGGKTEEHIDSLAIHLADWLEEERDNNLVFHTFSNTGWLIYGAVLEKFEEQDRTLMGRIKGCVVDSAPVADADPQVWASGFSAAILKRNSVAAKGNTDTHAESQPDMKEAALLVILENFFKVVLSLPSVNRRLSGVVEQLKTGQPSCPQLYIYSSADKVIPVGYIESFMKEQQKMGRHVTACNFISTPHVDHFRNHPNLYSSQLALFIDDSVFASCRPSAS